MPRPIFMENFVTIHSRFRIVTKFSFLTAGHTKGKSAIQCSKTRCTGARMKKDEKGILLILFCAGIIGGLLFPRWLNLGTLPDLGIVDLESIQKYSALKVGNLEILKSAAKSRLTLMLLLYFSVYTAAGFWMLAGTSLIFGASLGFMAALSVIQMGWLGILFLGCTLMPQWIFYGLAGSRIADFMKRRRERTALCSGNPVQPHSWKIFLEFLVITAIVGAGIGAEVCLNPLLLRLFLKFT